MTRVTPMEAQSKGPRAITRVFELMKLLARAKNGMTLAELSTALAVPKSTLIDTLRGLCDLQYLTQSDGGYRLGHGAYHFASRIVANWSAPDMIRLEIRKLALETGESVGFAIPDWEIGQVFYTEAVNSLHPVRYAMQAGIRAPLYASAAGRVLLAYADPERVDQYLAYAKLKALTDETRTSREAIRRNLEEIRQQGYCASFGEMLRDTAALAVPVHGPDGTNLGALMLAAPLDRMKRNHDRFLDAILAAGQYVSADLT